ncbi:acyl carrier protein [Gorillibacterium sp. sgz500922]|uniref:acyl carrier protein n=1 Tax=Gorillibacterium sp. sgz500922 TaxID=3446694 RepID=UPI003F67FFBE
MSTIQNEDLALEQKIKHMIIERLGLDITPEDIDPSAPIFGTDKEGKGLDLDSVDALELVVGIREVFGIKHQSDDLSVLENVQSIAAFIRGHNGQA